MKKALFFWLSEEEIKPEELMTLLVGTKRAKPGETIESLTLPKIKGILQNAESFRVPILKARAA